MDKTQEMVLARSSSIKVVLVPEIKALPLYTQLQTAAFSTFSWHCGQCCDRRNCWQHWASDFIYTNDHHFRQDAVAGLHILPNIRCLFLFLYNNIIHFQVTDQTQPFCTNSVRTSHPDLLTLAIPPWVGTLSTSVLH